MGSLLCNDSVQIAGVNVSGDLKRIGKDFNVSEMKAVEQKTRPNVHNLSTYARQRDVIQDAKHGSMVLLGELVLGIKVDKSQQVSDWSGQLSEAQKRYAAEDAAISLELYEKLKAMPDLTLRLKVDELVPGKKVDLVPQKGSSVPVASLNTRAATATLIGTQPCPCPPGIVPKRGNLRPNEMTSIKPCPNSYVVVKCDLGNNTACSKMLVRYFIDNFAPRGPTRRTIKFLLYYYVYSGCTGILHCPAVQQKTHSRVFVYTHTTKGRAGFIR